MSDYNYVKIISDDDWGLLEITPQNKPRKPLITKIEEEKIPKKNLITFCNSEEIKQMEELNKPKTRLIGRQTNRNILVGFR